MFNPYATRQKPVVNEHEVKGFVANDERRPDRYFYVLYEDHIWECDGWCVKEPSGKENWMILIVCPACGNTLKLDSERKPILVDEYGLATGEPIRCSHPAEFGGTCRWCVEFEPARKRRPITTRKADGTVVEVTLDAIAKKA